MKTSESLALQRSGRGSINRGGERRGESGGSGEMGKDGAESTGGLTALGRRPAHWISDAQGFGKRTPIFFFSRAQSKKKGSVHTSFYAVEAECV